MKRMIKFSDGISFIFVFAIGTALFSGFSDNFTLDDAFMVLFFMLVGFISIFLLFGEKVK